MNFKRTTNNTRTLWYQANVSVGKLQYLDGKKGEYITGKKQERYYKLNFAP